MGTDKVTFVEERWGATGSDTVRMLDQKWRHRKSRDFSPYFFSFNFFPYFFSLNFFSRTFFPVPVFPVFFPLSFFSSISFPVPFFPQFVFPYFFPRTFSNLYFSPYLFTLFFSRTFSNNFFPVFFTLYFFFPTFPIILFPVLPPVLFFPVLFSRTLSNVATFEIQRFKISVSCFSRTFRYNTVHVPSGISIQTSTAGLPWKGGVRGCAIWRDQKWIYLT